MLLTVVLMFVFCFVFTNVNDTVSINQCIRIPADKAGELQAIETGENKRYTQTGLHIHL